MKKLLIVILILAIVLFSGCDMLGDLSNKNFSNKNIKPVQEKPGYYTDEKHSIFYPRFLRKTRPKVAECISRARSGRAWHILVYHRTTL